MDIHPFIVKKTLKKFFNKCSCKIHLNSNVLFGIQGSSRLIWGDELNIINDIAILN